LLIHYYYFDSRFVDWLIDCISLYEYYNISFCIFTVLVHSVLAGLQTSPEQYQL